MNRSGADELLIAELAAGKTVKDAAAAAGVGERTAFRRLEDPTFRTRVAEARRRMVSEASGRLSASMSDAADTLRNLLGSEDERVQLASAVKLIELGLKAVELTELAAEVEELQARLGCLDATARGESSDATE